MLRDGRHQPSRRRAVAALRRASPTVGFDASLDQIAAHAGVGVGTIYRFPALIDTLFEELFEARIAEVAAPVNAPLA